MAEEKSVKREVITHPTHKEYVREKSYVASTKALDDGEKIEVVWDCPDNLEDFNARYKTTCFKDVAEAAVKLFSHTPNYGVIRDGFNGTLDQYMALCQSMADNFTIETTRKPSATKEVKRKASILDDLATKVASGEMTAKQVAEYLRGLKAPATQA